MPAPLPEIDHGDDMPKDPAKWEGEVARKARQEKWARDQAFQDALRRHRRWQTMVWYPTILLGLAFAAVCGCDWTGVTHFGIINSRAPWLEEDAPPPPAPVAYASPKRVMAEPRPVVVAHGPVPVVATPVPIEDDTPAPDLVAIERAQRQVDHYTKALNEAAEKYQAKAAAVNDMLAYLYGSWGDPAKTIHIHDGLIERTKIYADGVASWEQTLPNTPQAIDADHAARVNINNANIEIQNSLKQLDYDQGLLSDYAAKATDMKAKLDAAIQALQHAQNPQTSDR